MELLPSMPKALSSIHKKMREGYGYVGGSEGEEKEDGLVSSSRAWCRVTGENRPKRYSETSCETLVGQPRVAVTGTSRLATWSQIASSRFCL